MPIIAAPMAAPTMAISEIGVSMTRSWPNSSDRPSVTVKPPPKPPGTPRSSPSRKTEGSARIATRSASRSASVMLMRRVPEACSVGESGIFRITNAPSVGEHVVQALVGRRLGARHSERHRLFDFRLTGTLDPFQFALALLEFVEELSAEQVHRVALAPLLELLLAAVVACVAARVALVAVGLVLQQRRPFTGASA